MIRVGGQERGEALRPDFQAALQRMNATGRFLRMPADVSALRMREAADPGALLREMTSLLRHRNHVDIQIFDIPRRPGWKGAVMVRLKQALWKLLRYQHDRVCFRQNLVNSHTTALLEFQREHFTGELNRLKARVADLEAGRGMDRPDFRRSA
jgi:hypothetical protein